MAETPESLRRALADGAGELAKVAHDDKRILDAAADHRDNVNGELKKLRGTALTDEAAGDRYLALIEERGTLDQVSGRHGG